MDRKRVLITGAAGKLGKKVRSHLEAQGRYDLVLLDQASGGDPAVHEIDLCADRVSWEGLVSGVEVVIHLAANPRPSAPWRSLGGPNLDAVLNVFEAARRESVDRVIFASSVQTCFGHLGRRVPIDSADPGNPVNFYGALKLVGERLGRHYAECHGISVICLRIGWVQDGKNAPGRHMGEAWKQHLWLSDRDLCQGVERAVMAPGGVKFEVLNLLSENDGSPWDLSRSEQVIGYRPQDTHVPDVASVRLLLGRLVRKAGRIKRQALRSGRAPRQSET